MKILVCGGRDYLDYIKVKATVDSIVDQVENPDEVVIIHGGAG